MRRAQDWLIVALFLVPPYAALSFATFWWYAPLPITVSYQHPKFVAVPAHSRAEAEAQEVDRVRGGSVVWVYRELCADGPIDGSVQSRWKTESFVWAAPERPLADLVSGCGAYSSNVTVPTSSPSRTFTYSPSWVLQRPMFTRVMVLPEIQVRVLSPMDADGEGL